MNVKEGTRGVGIATTKAVVTSSILILISDFFLSKLLWVVEKWIL
jgi:phospholipid/cholesterol/gamma-HCH transport system permease protein